MEEEICQNKRIYHNYGQGGAEVSLAYGCSYMIHKIFIVKNQVTTINNVAVLGSGINALFTSLQLLKRGFKVTLYSEHLPHPQKYNPQNAKGLQFWYPGNYDNCDPLRHELLSKLSFEFYKQCVLASRYRSLSFVDCYASGPKAEDIREFITEFIIEDISQAEVDFGCHSLEQYSCFKTILIDTELLMKEIMTEIQLRSVQFSQKKFLKLDDVLSIP